jgi:hemerythrin-like metal-binding protein
MHVRWNESLAVGHEELDDLQLELFRRATQLVDAARAARAPETRAHVARLSELASVMFQTEEQLLREAGSQSLARHAAEHQRFLTDLALLSTELKQRGPAALADLQVARYVAGWLEAHVGQTDRDLDRLPSPIARA